jgi:putative ABC transport system ATP-binding protein
MALFASSRSGATPQPLPTRGEPLITLRDIEKTIDVGGQTNWILRRITLDIKAGEFVTIMGPSGAGKSTLLAILGMLDHEWRGEYHLGGTPVHGLSPRERAATSRRLVGFVFQQYHLLDDLTVAENLAVPLDYRDVPKSERQALVADTLDRFGIVGKKDLFPRQLSGGQQQLVGIARAVIAKPALLLADEPTGNLHSEQARDIMAMFKKLNDEGATVVQVTHSEENARWGNRVIRLKDGWLESA